MIAQLADWLVKLTGYDAAVCMQPNSGAQGEYAGLLAIRHYHGKPQRRASRYLPDPGFCARHQPRLPRIRQECRWWLLRDKNGNIDLTDLRAKAEQAGDNLSCIMVTYPSTHGGV